MNITMWLLGNIKPYRRNARKVPAEAIDKVAVSLKEFGWRQPIVVDKEGVIICGHTRLLAAQKLGLKEAPVHVADNLTPAQVRAYRLLDNRSHEQTTWDEDLLGLELLDLKGLGVDLDLTGFDLDEIDTYLANVEGGHSGLTDDDAAPEVPEVAASRPGDCLILGDHRVLCADSTDIKSLEKVLDGGLADMAFCDPPFNVDYRGGPAKRGRTRRAIANDNLGLAFEQFLSDACRNMLEVTKGALYICCPLPRSTRSRKPSLTPAVTGRPLLSGPRIHSRWVGPTTKDSTSPCFTDGKREAITSGVARAIRGMCGL